MSIESAKDVSVISEHTEIASKKITVQTVEANVSATEAHISAETLQQTNIITETNIADAVVGEMKAENIHVENIVVQYVLSGQAEASVGSLAPSTSGWIHQAQQTPVRSMAAANDAGQAVTVRKEINISGQAEASADSLAPSTSGWIGQAQQTPVQSKAAADDAGQAVTVREDKKISGSGKSSSKNFFQKRKQVAKFKKIVNRDAYWKSKDSITGLYKDQRLVEPEFETNPRIRELSHFFGGEMALKTKEYCKDAEFSALVDNISEGKFVTMEQLIQSFHSQKNRLIAIVGQAGSGKTTFTKRLVHASCKNSSKIIFKKWFKKSFTFEIIYFVNIRDLLESDSITAMELLFGNITDLSEESQKYGYEWIIENQEKVIFFFDGLDQATWSPGGHHPKINHNEKSSTPTVMYNVIIGHLFPRVKIVISSREHSIAALTVDLRPQLIYALVGLSPDDVKRLFIALLGDIGQQQWNRMCSTSPAIIPLSSVPVFLVYNAIVQKFNPENPPDTMTGVMLEILDILLKSQHVRDKQVLHKLKEMAFRAMSEGRVVFTEDELLKFGIDPDSIQDLVIKVPGRTRASHCLLEGTQQIYFSHQVIEENLAAMFVSEMGVGEFEEFVNEFIHQDHWSVVRKFLCGILLNPALAIDWPSQMLQIKDKKAKEEILRGSLNEQLKETNDSTALMELFGALYESNDDELIRSHVRDIDFKEATINPSGMLAISSVMRRSGNLNLLRFSECNLTTELFDIMMSNLKDSQLKVKKFVLGNRFNAELFASVEKFTESYVDEMVLEKCKGNDEVGIISRSVISKKVFINEVDLYGNKMSEQLSIETGIVCSKYNVECLHLINANLREIHLRNFLKHVGNGKLKKLYVGLNCNLGVKGIAVTGIIVSQCGVEKVGMWDCNLTAEAMKAFKENVRDAKFKELYVGYNRDLGVGGMGVTGIIVSQCEVEKVGMQGCNLTAEEMKAFKENVRDAKINWLDLSWNDVSKLGDEGLSTISEIVHQCQVQTLCMFRCYFNDDQLKRFKALIADTGVEFKC
ncbi:NACHT, LRR and PYD domains-containing protein 4C-like [Styela clava]